MAINFTNTVRTPHAAVLVWNYVNRLDANNVSAAEVQEVKPVTISTLSLISIATSKSKGSAAGNFQLTLAPTRNWVEVLTPGSWLAIMMGTRKIEAKDFTTAAPDLVKMLGRIDSVRMNVGVDQATSARQTTYTVQGQDWGQIFDTNLYIDPIARDDRASAVSNAERFIYEELLTDITSKSYIPTSSQNVSKLMRLIARPIEGLTEVQVRAGVLLKPENNFTFPQDLVNFFKFKSLQGSSSTAVGNAIEFIKGKLVGEDDYHDTNEAVGIIDTNSIFGQHSLWQLMTDNCNHILNELVTDMRWDQDEGEVEQLPSLVLYKRIKPFVIRDNSPDLDGVRDIVSKFTLLKHVEIPLENVIAINAGNNWRDKYNFIEVQIDKSLVEFAKASQVKLDSQSFDAQAFNREGFRPMIVQTNLLPPGKTGGPILNPYAVTAWKALLRAWYFETHNLLNGAITFMGIDEHIKVGDNILINAKVLGQNYNMNEVDRKHKVNGNEVSSASMLAHVENISHSFVVDPTSGTRSFSTTISFVRGIIVNSDGKQFNEPTGDGRLDTVSKFLDEQEKNTANVLATSTDMDPGEKVKGT